jgi:hypothetical protein
MMNKSIKATIAQISAAFGIKIPGRAEIGASLHRIGSDSMKDQPLGSVVCVVMAAILGHAEVPTAPQSEEAQQDKLLEAYSNQTEEESNVEQEEKRNDSEEY